MTMSKGEKAELTIEPEWAYGKKGNIDAKYPLFIEAKNSAFVCRSWICCSRIYLYHSYGEFLVGTPCSSGQQQFHVAQELWSFLFIMQFECIGIPIQTLLDPARHCVTFSLKKVTVPFLVVPKNIQTPLMDGFSIWNLPPPLTPSPFYYKFHFQLTSFFPLNCLAFKTHLLLEFAMTSLGWVLIVPGTTQLQSMLYSVYNVICGEFYFTNSIFLDVWSIQWAYVLDVSVHQIICLFHLNNC